MDLALEMDLRGEMPRERLLELRERLGLEQRGRLDDVEDVDFGDRYLNRESGHYVLLSLSRHRDRPGLWEAPSGTQWSVSLTFQAEPPSPAVIDELRADIESAAEQLGLTVERVWRKDGL